MLPGKGCKQKAGTLIREVSVGIHPFHEKMQLCYIPPANKTDLYHKSYVLCLHSCITAATQIYCRVFSHKAVFINWDPVSFIRAVEKAWRSYRESLSCVTQLALANSESSPLPGASPFH